MELKNLIDTAVPTPFGWVINTVHEPDFAGMMRFRNQLLSLASAAGKTVPIREAAVVELAAKPQAQVEEVFPLEAA